MTPTPAWYEADSDDSDRNVTDDITASTPQEPRGTILPASEPARGFSDADLLRRRTAALNRTQESRDKWKAEAERLENNLSALLCGLTGGRLSKTTYDVQTMVQAIEEEFERQADDELVSLRAEVERLRADVEGVTLSLSERDRALTACNADFNRLYDEKQRLSERAAADVLEATSRAEAAEAKLRDVEALADEWLTPTRDHLGRLRTWWEEEDYGKRLRAVLARSVRPARGPSEARLQRIHDRLINSPFTRDDEGYAADDEAQP